MRLVIIIAWQDACGGSVLALKIVHLTYIVRARHVPQQWIERGQFVLDPSTRTIVQLLK